jgi:hypothetical protein
VSSFFIFPRGTTTVGALRKVSTGLGLVLSVLH